MRFLRFYWLLLLVGSPVFGQEACAPKRSVILIIRHAEKPESGEGLSAAGVERAAKYVDYFKNFEVGSNSLHLTCLIATADSKKSHRPRLTIEPLSKATGLPVSRRFKHSQIQELVGEIKVLPPDSQVLICWHHGDIPPLLSALGADPKQLLPQALWPGSVFNWVIQLRYEEHGRLLEAKRIETSLVPADRPDPAGH